MKKLIVHHERIDSSNYEQLIKVCPFSAIEENDGIISINAACRMCGICTKKGISGAIEMVETEDKTIDKSLWKGIAVFIDCTEGKIHPVSFELIGKAKELARVINHPVYAICIGHNLSDAAEKILYYGVDEVFTYDYPQLENFLIEPYAAAFEHFIEMVRPSSILVGATNVGRSLAPRVAAHFRTGLTADCTALEMRANTDLVQIRPAFGGNIMAQIVTQNNRPQFCTVRYKVFSEPKIQKNPSGRITNMTISPDKLKSAIGVIEKVHKPKQIDISEAEIIIAVGRGFKSKKDLEMIEELAELIGAQIACTRPLIEACWFDPRLQIGLSGRTVKPKLIICAGLSGSVQFAAGMKSSDFIVAINQNHKASIFDIAHLGLIGDMYEVLPQVIHLIQSRRAIHE
ncbi:MAG: FAD-binding protein [Acetivibrionales bacterium]|jgi:electron transfer flavoprotein alpha subunit